MQFIPMKNDTKFRHGQNRILLDCFSKQEWETLANERFDDAVTNKYQAIQSDTQFIANIYHQASRNQLQEYRRARRIAKWCYPESV